MSNFFKCDICGREIFKMDPESIYKIKIKDLNEPEWDDCSKEKHYLCFRCGAKVHKLIMDYKKEVNENGKCECAGGSSCDVSKSELGEQSSSNAGQASMGDLSETLGEALKELAAAFNSGTKK